MEIIPFIHLTKQFEKETLPSFNLKEMKETHNISDLYIIDKEGIEKNRPRFCFYQRYSSLFDLWVDAGPRSIEDIVDNVFAGAKRIVIRATLWSEPSIASIRELTENDIFLAISLDGVINNTYPKILFNEVDGVIIFIPKEFQKIGFKHESTINRVSEKKPCYIFSNNDISFWKEKNIKGYLQDVATLR
jgi:hypothetical protein